MTRRALTSLLAVAAFAVGCAHGGSAAPNKTVVTSGLRGPYPTKIAVLPFETVAGPQDLGPMVAQLFQQGLEAHVTLVSAAEVEKALGKQKKVIDRPTARKLGKALGVDSVLYGSAFILLGDDEHQYYPEREPEVGIIAKMVDVKSGGILWSMSTTATKPATVLALTTTVTEAAHHFIQTLVGDMVTAFVQQKPVKEGAQASRN